MKITACTKNYWEFVRKLRNDQDVSEGFIERTKITKEMQNQYMLENAKYYRIALYNNNPAGYVGVIDNDIRICVHPKYQGKKIGKFLLDECFKIWPKAIARIKIENILSQKLFESVGFKKKFFIYER